MCLENTQYKATETWQSINSIDKAYWIHCFHFKFNWFYLLNDSEIQTYFLSIAPLVLCALEASFCSLPKLFLERNLSPAQPFFFIDWLTCTTIGLKKNSNLYNIERCQLNCFSLTKTDCSILLKKKFWTSLKSEEVAEIVYWCLEYWHKTFVMGKWTVKFYECI